jgi:hypothetical protein
MIGYVNTGSYTPKICPKMLVMSCHFIFPPLDKEEDDLIEFLVNLVNDYFANKNHILSYFG